MHPARRAFIEAIGAMVVLSGVACSEPGSAPASAHGDVSSSSVASGGYGGAATGGDGGAGGGHGGAGAAGGAGGGDASFELRGAVQKGPFLVGTSLTVSVLDAAANPTGENYLTQTTNDLGEFELVLDDAAFVAIEGTGFYYNEVTGELSGANLTLRAHAEVGAMDPAFVNLVTHLTFARVRGLIGAAMSFADARAQAEQELREQLQVGPVGFDPAVPGTSLNVLGDDNDANAYLFAVSTVLAQVAATRAEAGGSADAHLQEVLNALSLDLAEDGMLLAGIVDEIQAAEATVDGDAVESALAARLTSIGSSATVPDIDRILDTDNDGVANADDNCVRVANPDQEEIVGVCDWTARPLGQPALANGDGAAIGDFDGDGNDDAVIIPSTDDSSVTLTWMGGDGEGGFDFADIPMVFPTGEHPQAGPGHRSVLAADLTQDGLLDIAVLSNGISGGWFFIEGNGDGTFTEVASPLDPAGMFRSKLALGDINGDDEPDIVGGSDGRTSVIASLSLPSGGRAPVAEVPMALPTGFSALALGDLDDDGALDIVLMHLVVNNADAWVTVYLGDGQGGFTAAHSSTHFTGFTEDLVVTDYDGDGHLDVGAMVSYNRSHEVHVWRGDGDGGLAPALIRPLPDDDWGIQQPLAGPEGAFIATGSCVFEATTSRQQLLRVTADGIVDGPSFQLPGCSPTRGDFDGNGQQDALFLFSGGAGAGLLLVNP